MRPAAFVRAGGQASQQQHSDLEVSSTTRDIWLRAKPETAALLCDGIARDFSAKVALQI